ncbi:hypothetical protein QOT17_004978 [Balamuthia mandrillaris]
MEDGRELVVVFGPCGNVGKELLPLLLEQRARLRLRLAYHQKKPDVTEEEGVECVQASFDSVEAVAVALQGNPDRIVFMLPTVVGIHPMTKNFVEAVKSACLSSLKQIVMVTECVPVSVVLQKTSFYREVSQVFREVANSGLPFTQLEPCCFLQDWLLFFGLLEFLKVGCPNDSTFSLAASPNRGVQWIDVRDVAEAVTSVLEQPPEKNVGRHFHLVGDPGRTVSECLVAVSTLLGHRIRYQQMPVEDAIALFKGLGMPEWMANDFPNIFRNLPAFLEGVDSSDLQGLLRNNRKPYSMEEFFAHYKQVFLDAYQAGQALKKD